MMRVEHEWTPDLLAAAVEQWRRLLDLHNGSAYELVPCGGSHYPRHVTSQDVTDEWVTALVISDGEGVELPVDRDGYRPSYAPVEISLISYSDHGGNDYDAANVRALADTPGVTTSTDGVRGAGEATMRLGEMPSEPMGLAESVARIRYVADLMESLESDGGPLIDEEVHAEYVAELADAAWDQWLGSDIRSTVEAELAALIGDDAASDAWDAADDDAVREAFYGYAHPSGEGWRAETATTVVHAHEDAAVRHVLAKVFSRTDVPNDCEHCQYGTH